MAYRLLTVYAVTLALALLWGGVAGAETRGIGGDDDNALRCQQAAEDERGDADSLRICTAALENFALKGADRAATFANRSVILVNRKSYAWAAADCDKAIALDPKNGSAYVNRGAARLGQKRYAEALTDIDQGLALGPPNPSRAWFNRGMAHEGLSDYPAAVADYEKALTLRPDWPLAKERLAVAQGNAREGAATSRR
jgi:tetratricopeptide (TPR) repeat protein